MVFSGQVHVKQINAMKIHNKIMKNLFDAKLLFRSQYSIFRMEKFNIFRELASLIDNKHKYIA